MNKGTLTLIPIPIDEVSQLAQDAKDVLKTAFENKDFILVEEAKPCRRRWIHYGLPREAISDFVLYNEHTRSKVAFEMINELKKGKNVFLMSDCGLPAFCDPGAELVSLCHDHNIKVTSTSFPNSVILAVALSGFNHSRFIFEGFIPSKGEQRISSLKRILKNNDMSILMDTPYRLTRLLEDLDRCNCDREIFLAMDLNYENELLLRGDIKSLLKKVENQKREFILLIGPKNVRR